MQDDAKDVVEKQKERRVTRILTDNFARIVFPLTICACEHIRDGMCQELFSQPLQAGREKCSWKYEIVFMLNCTWFLKPHNPNCL